MNHGKSIELYLVNGTADGMEIAELSNWNGKAIKILRNEVATCDREDFQGAGVYFLFCSGEDGAEGLYLGEAENVKERLRQHIRDAKTGKEPYYWNTAVCFFGQDLNKTMIRYLEHRFAELVELCGRSRLLTKKTYGRTVMKEWHRAAMEEFIENAGIVMNALGYRVLVPRPTPSAATHYFFAKRQVHARRDSRRTQVSWFSRDLVFLHERLHRLNDTEAGIFGCAANWRRMAQLWTVCFRVIMSSIRHPPLRLLSADGCPMD